MSNLSILAEFFSGPRRATAKCYSATLLPNFSYFVLRARTCTRLNDLVSIKREKILAIALTLAR